MNSKSSRGPLARLFFSALVPFGSVALVLGSSCGGGTRPTPDTGSDAGDAKDAGDAGPLASILNPSARPQHLAIDAFNIYWTDSNGTLRKRQLGVGGQDSQLAAGATTPFSIAVGLDDLYYGGLADDAGVHAVSKTGGAPVALAAHENYVQAMALAGDRLFWSSFAQPHTPSTAQIRSAQVDGGSPETHATGLDYARALAVDADAVYTTSGEFATCATTCKLQKIMRATGVVSTLVLGVRVSLSIVLDDAFVYYGDRDTGALMKVSKSGGTPSLVAHLPGEPSDIFYDQPTGALYVSLFAPIGSGRFGAVYKVRTTGGELVLVAKTTGISSFGESPLVVDPSGVYFGAGALWTAPK